MENAFTEREVILEAGRKAFITSAPNALDMFEQPQRCVVKREMITDDSANSNTITQVSFTAIIEKYVKERETSYNEQICVDSSGSVSGGSGGSVNDGSTAGISSTLPPTTGITNTSSEQSSIFV